MYAVTLESTATAACYGRPDVLAPIEIGLLTASALLAKASATALVAIKPISDRPTGFHIGPSSSL
jgi:hypothetical protein